MGRDVRPSLFSFRSSSSTAGAGEDMEVHHVPELPNGPRRHFSIFIRGLADILAHNLEEYSSAHPMSVKMGLSCPAALAAPTQPARMRHVRTKDFFCLVFCTQGGESSSMSQPLYPALRCSFMFIQSIDDSSI